MYCPDELGLLYFDGSFCQHESILGDDKGAKG